MTASGPLGLNEALEVTRVWAQASALERGDLDAEALVLGRMFFQRRALTPPDQEVWLAYAAEVLTPASLGVLADAWLTLLPYLTAAWRKSGKRGRPDTDVFCIEPAGEAAGWPGLRVPLASWNEAHRSEAAWLLEVIRRGMGLRNPQCPAFHEFIRPRLRHNPHEDHYVSGLHKNRLDETMACYALLQFLREQGQDEGDRSWMHTRRHVLMGQAWACLPGWGSLPAPPLPAPHPYSPRAHRVMIAEWTAEQAELAALPHDELLARLFRPDGSRHGAVQEAVEERRGKFMIRGDLQEWLNLAERAHALLGREQAASLGLTRVPALFGPEFAGRDVLTLRPLASTEPPPQAP